MRRSQVLRALEDGVILAAELRRVGASVRWAGVYPLNPTRPSTEALLRRSGINPSTPLPTFRVRVFEIADALADTWFGEEDMINKSSRVVEGPEALFAALEELGVPIQELRPAADTAYPL